MKSRAILLQCVHHMNHSCAVITNNARRMMFFEGSSGTLCCSHPNKLIRGNGSGRSLNVVN